MLSWLFSLLERTERLDCTIKYRLTDWEIITWMQTKGREVCKGKKLLPQKPKSQSANHIHHHGSRNIMTWVFIWEQGIHKAVKMLNCVLLLYLTACEVKKKKVWLAIVCLNWNMIPTFLSSCYQGKLPEDKNFQVFVGCKIYSILHTSFFPKASVSE